MNVTVQAFNNYANMHCNVPWYRAGMLSLSRKDTVLLVWLTFVPGIQLADHENQRARFYTFAVSYPLMAGGLQAIWLVAHPRHGACHSAGPAKAGLAGNAARHDRFALLFKALSGCLPDRSRPVCPLR
jgi:hypothetical protein